MKILMTTDWNETAINGVVTSVMNLKRGLEARGHEVRILTLSDTVFSRGEGDRYYVGSVWMGYVYPKARARIPSPIFPQFISEIIEWNPDIVHSNCEISTFHIAVHIAKLMKVPLVHTYHTIYEHYFKYFPFFAPFPRTTKRYIRNRSRRVARQSSCMVAPTRKVENLLKSYGIKSRIAVIPSGIDLSRFTAEFSPDEKNKIRRELGIPDDHTILVHIGRMAREKNIIELINFMDKLKGRKLTLLIVGGGPYQEMLKESTDAAGMSDHIVYSGMIAPEQVYRYYKTGDIFISASQSETQGLCYIEALSCGTPLLCRYDTCLDDVVDEGKNGWVYHSPEEFFEKLEKFLAMSDEERALMKENTLISSEKFSVPVFAESIESLYEQVIEEVSGRAKSQ